jgi:hypothetical protein
MKRLVRSLITGALLVPSSFVNAQSSPPPVFYAADFGAIPDDEADDRAAIQAALDAAGAAGGGIVVLGPGMYHLLMIEAYGTGGTYGHHGVLVPAHCTLTGAGMNLTTVRLLPGNANPDSVGDGIINKGYQTATEDYKADGDIHVSNLRVDTLVTNVSPTGNLVAFCHADGVVVSSVALGSSRHHGIEINRSRNVILEDCVWDGHHIGASSLQLDIGAVGAKSVLPTTTTLENILLRRCTFTGRSDETNSYNVKVVELNHTNSTCLLHNVAFEDCTFEGLPATTSTCVSVDNPPSNEINGLRFERCHFIGKEETVCANGMLNLPLQGERVLRNLVVRDCEFTGAFSYGIVLIHSDPSYNVYHNMRTGILLEGNRFAPSFDRLVPTGANSMRMICVSACSDVTIRRNLFEFPATASNLTLGNSIYALQAANCLDTKIEDNVITWAHGSAATAPLTWFRMGGIYAPVYQLEQSGFSSRARVTGNLFLYPQNGVGAALNMSTGIPTTSWAPGGPWVGGLIAGNFASGLTTLPGAPVAWYVHHDLAGAGNIGQILPEDPARTKANGWYPCNGTPLTWLDSGTNRLPRVNGNRCGFETNLPSQPGSVVRLHGPMTGEGLLAPALSRYAGSVFKGNVDTPGDLRSLLPADLTRGDIRVVRKPLGTFVWDPDLDAATAPAAALRPSELPEGDKGLWAPFNAGLDLLADDADTDGDGLTNRQERAFLGDPTQPDSPEVLTLNTAEDGTHTVSFHCAAGPDSPRICLQSSENLTDWTIESSCPGGGSFSQPPEGSVVELPSRTGRVVTFAPGGELRKFWRLVLDP